MLRWASCPARGLLHRRRQVRRPVRATLEDAAVKLRRLGPYIEGGAPARLLAGALEAVERAAEGAQPAQ